MALLDLQALEEDKAVRKGGRKGGSKGSKGCSNRSTLLC